MGKRLQASLTPPAAGPPGPQQGGLRAGRWRGAGWARWTSWTRCTCRRGGAGRGSGGRSGARARAGDAGGDPGLPR